MPKVQIPTLDISEFSGADDAFVAALGKGYEEFGFCGITGHGLDAQIIANAYDALRDFFALPQETKNRYATGHGGARGYTGFGIETAKDSEFPDLKEFWQVGREVPAGQPCHPSLFENVWPEEIENFRDSVCALYDALDSLGNRVLDALAIYLGLPANYFRDKVNMGNSILRQLHYPPIAEQSTQSLRAAAHEDINLITLLVGSDEQGLEVLSRDGDWIPVTSHRDTIVVNIGDMMQRLTNHVLPSTTHRVVNSDMAYTGKSRYSIPFFLHPNADFEIVTLEGCISEDNPNRYPEPITADDYLHERLVEIGLLADEQVGDAH